ncbi:MAG: hypothetical protein RMK19_02960 [Bacteroidia bacterium]|nr:hypothetical protein [Bacteroidia bacterium]MDW8014952.1 hypothetical protein [Bacteroidia bacterium]
MRYAILILIGGLLWSQPPAPTGRDQCGYVWHTIQSTVLDSAPAYNWVDPLTLNGGNPNVVTGLGDDNFVGPITLPFSFVYYWNSYDRIYVGSNGYITFGRGGNVASGAPPYFQRFPRTARPNEWIAVYLADLTFADEQGLPVPGAKLLYGTDNQGRFVITWDSVPYWTNETPGHWRGRNTFQVILDPNDSSITLQYKQIEAGFDSTYRDGNYNVVGMENITGQSGLDIAAAWPVPFQEFAIRIYHPREFACQALDIQADWVLTPRGEAVFTVQGGEAPALTGGLLNTGNQTIQNRIRSILGILPPGALTPVHRDTVIFDPPTGPGQELIATYQKPLSGISATPLTSLSTSSYVARQTVSILGASEGFRDNNQYETELVISYPVDSGVNRGRYLLRYDDGEWDPQAEGGGGVGFPQGMTFVAPQDLVVEALSADMAYELGSPNNGPIVFWVFEYDPLTGAIGERLDSIVLAVEDFEEGETLAVYTNQQQTIFVFLQRYTLPLSNPISLQKGRGLAVGFATQYPSELTPERSINYIVSNTASPIARRALEGIGGIWAPYRDLEAEEYAVGLVARIGEPGGLPISGPPPQWRVELFPNPAATPPFLRISLLEAGEVVVRVVDMQGRTVGTECRFLPAGESILPLSVKLTAGIYGVGVTYKGYTKGFRLVVP